MLSRNDRLFVLAREGERTTGPLAAVGLSVVFLLVVGLPIEFLIDAVPWLARAPLDAGPFGMAALWLMASLALRFVPLAVVVLAWVRLYERRPVRTVGFARPSAVSQSVRGAGVGATMFLVVVGLLWLSGHLGVRPSAGGFVGLPAVASAIAVFAGWAIQGSSEEIMFRGWLLPVIGSRWGSWAGVLVSAAVFSATHAFNPGIGVLSLVNLFLIGVFLALFALWEGGLWGVCAIHAAWNWMQGTVLGFSVSGADSQIGATVFNLRTNGSSWVSGGGFGPEGGIVDTAVEVCGILVMVFLLRRRLRA